MCHFMILFSFQGQYFIDDQTVCYCETCSQLRGDELYYRKGEPPREFTLPLGWCKFRLKLSPSALELGSTDKWHIAFHGTSPAVVRSLLDRGELVNPCKRTNVQIPF